MKQLTTTFFITIFIISTSSCSSLSPYKVPVLQGNIYEDEDLKKLEEEVMLKEQQLKKIINNYREFMKHTQQRRRRRRQGLLF